VGSGSNLITKNKGIFDTYLTQDSPTTTNINLGSSGGIGVYNQQPYPNLADEFLSLGISGTALGE
jgi:hypothetical protein